jgi:hypothetical protein
MQTNTCIDARALKKIKSICHEEQAHELFQVLPSPCELLWIGYHVILGD